MEKKFESGLISRDEVKRMLRITDERTLSYKKNFKVVIVGDGYFYDRREIINQIGTDFTEPFLTTEEAIAHMNIPESEFMSLIRKEMIPFYSLYPSKKGSRRLFKRSELDILKEEPLKIPLYSNSGIIDIMRMYGWMKDLLLSCMQEEHQLIFLTAREKEVLIELLNGNTFEGLAKKFTLSRNRVRMIFEKAKRRIQGELSNELKKIISSNKELLERNHILESKFKKLEDRLPPENTTMDASQIEIHNILKTKIADLDLSVRTLNCLREAEIITIADLVSYEEGELLRLRNFGEKSLDEIKEVLREKALRLGIDALKYNVPPTKESLRIERAKILAKNIAEFDFTPYTFNRLRSIGFERVSDIAGCSSERFIGFTNFGKKSLKEIKLFLHQNNLWFGMEVEDYGFKKKKINHYTHP